MGRGSSGIGSGQSKSSSVHGTFRRTQLPNVWKSVENMSPDDAYKFLRNVELYTWRAEQDEYYDMTLMHYEALKSAARSAGFYKKYEDFDKRLSEAVAAGHRNVESAMEYYRRRRY